MSEGSRREGFLVIADISGYTALLTDTELEHAQGIIEDLVVVIQQALMPGLEFVKLEGERPPLLCRCGALHGWRAAARTRRELLLRLQGTPRTDETGNDLHLRRLRGGVEPAAAQADVGVGVQLGERGRRAR